MTVTYSSTLKTTRMQAVINAIDAGSAGTMELCTAAYAVVLAIIQLPKPSFSISGSTITLLGVPLTEANANNTGTAAAARFKDSSGNVIITGLTVGVGTGDVQMLQTGITAGQPVTITRGQITHG